MKNLQPTFLLLHTDVFSMISEIHASSTIPLLTARFTSQLLNGATNVVLHSNPRIGSLDRMTRPRRLIIQPHIFFLRTTHTTWLVNTCSSEPAEEFTCLGRRTSRVGFSWVGRWTTADFSDDCVGQLDSWCSLEIVELEGGDACTTVGLRFVGASVCPCTPDATVRGPASMEETDFWCIRWTVVVVHTRNPYKSA